MNSLYYSMQIESMRKKLLELVSIQGKFTDEKVVQLSQKLDEYLVEYQKMMHRGEAAAPYVLKFSSTARLKAGERRPTGVASNVSN